MYFKRRKVETQEACTLRAAAMEGTLDAVNPELLTAENLLTTDHVGCTALHWAAQFGHLDQVPRKLLTQENVMIRANNGETVLYKSANIGALHQVPVDLLTAENLLAGDERSMTPLHEAACGYLDQIPAGVLTAENLLAKNNYDETPLYFVVKHGDLNQVPLGLKFPDSVRELVGDEWWKQNQTILMDRAGLDESAEESVGVELF